MSTFNQLNNLVCHPDIYKPASTYVIFFFNQQRRNSLRKGKRSGPDLIRKEKRSQATKEIVKKIRKNKKNTKRRNMAKAWQAFAQLPRWNKSNPTPRLHLKKFKGSFPSK